MANGAGGGQAGGGGAGAAGAGAAGAEGQAGQVADALSDFIPVEDGKGKEGEVTPPVKEDDVAPPVEGAGEGEGGEPPIEPDTKDAEITGLKEQLASMQATINALAQGKGTVKPAEAAAAPPPPIVTDFVADQAEMDKVLDNPKELNALLAKVHNKAIEGMLKVMPNVIDTVVKTQMELRGSVADFYNTNKDLIPHKQFVGYTVNDLMGKNPDWPMTKVFSELGKEVRSRIGLKQQAAAGKKLPFPGKGGGSRQPVKHPAQGDTPLVEEIADLVTE